jgi:Leucine-rich repeat (LRR) protein
MKHFLVTILVLTLLVNSYSQKVVEITQVDAKGATKTFKTDRPDTLIKGMKVEPPAAQSVFDQPIFKTSADSIQFEKTQKAIREMVDGKRYDPIVADSIFAISTEVRSRIIGYRKVYPSNSDFFPFDSLAFKSDRSAIKQLSLSKVKSKKLPIEILTCKNLEELELVNTSIGRIQKKLNRLPQLKTIFIYNNNPKRSLKLKKNRYVETLIVRGDKPAKLPTNYSKLSRLTKLDLAQNALTKFPKGISKNKNLKELILNNNGISLINDVISPNPYLQKLDLGKNQIKKVPASIGGFKALKLLKFNNNTITEVDEVISKLQSLEQLSFYNNQLTTIPKGVYQLPALKEIDLYYNLIERLEPVCANWKKLEVLYLAFNKVFALPDNLGQLKNLQELYLHNNRLSSIPESVSEINGLRIFRANNNLLINWPESISKIQLLENLDLSNNSISTLPIERFQFSRLKILALVANPWDVETKKNLIVYTKSLRQRGVIVHLNSFDEEVE